MNFTCDWTTPHVKNWMSALGHLEGKPALGLEIGVWQGRSSIWFCQNILTHPDSRLICVDPCHTEENHQTFLSNIKEAGMDARVEFQKCRSIHMKVERPLDFAYVDGLHISKDVMNDAFMVWNKLKVGGVLIFDDYLWPSALHPWREKLSPHQFPSFAIEMFCVLMGNQFKMTHRGHQVIGTKMYP